MALNYYLDRVKDYKLRCYVGKEGERELHPVTYVLIWIMMPIGIGEITEKNLDKTFKRIHAYERLFGPMRRDTYLTYDDVKAHIGLRINGPDLSDTILKKNWMETLWRDKMQDASTALIQAVRGEG